MKSLLLAVTVSFVLLGVASANVVRPTPNVPWVDAFGKVQGLGSFKGKPVVLLISKSPRTWAFRAQVGQLHKLAERFATDNVIFMAAFTEAPGLIRSNIPFVLAADGPRTGYDFQAEGNFTIALIGRDGNLDYVTSKVLPAQRIFDLVGDSFVFQEKLRRP